MKEKYSTVLETATAEISEKKSRFIAHIAPVETQEEALEFIQKVKKEHYDARHNCVAYCIEGEQLLTRCSDDGEPSGTAGKPMLDVILGAGLSNVIVVVTRYFGGTLLGTGGLVRAYTKATREGLEACQKVTYTLGRKLKAICDYTAVGKIQYIFEREAITVVTSDYLEKVTFQLLVPTTKVAHLKDQLVELTNGSITLEEEGDVYYAKSDGKIMIK